MIYVEELKRAVDEATPRLLALGEASATPRRDGAWSPREIIGHLVDSASNNHQRFVRAQLQDDLVFPGYAQEAGHVPATIRMRRGPIWWRCGTFNLQIARVMDAVPDEIRLRERTRHNFDEIGFDPIPRPASHPRSPDARLRSASRASSRADLRPELTLTA